MTYIVEHKIMGKKVRQWWGYAYFETLVKALKGYDVVFDKKGARVFEEDGKTRVNVDVGK